MDRRQFIDNMIDTVRSLNISSIVGSRISLKSGGRHDLALCPFHNDNKLGSFYVTPQKRIFKCFSCGVGGDAIKFVAEFDGINYLHAAFKVALECGVITSSDYEEYFGRRRYRKDFVKQVERKYMELDKNKFENNIAPVDVLDKVFRVFINTFPLKEEHLKHLKEERGLTDEEIEEGLYFSFPDRRSMSRFTSQLSKEFPEQGSDVLEGIPGFYKKKYDNLWTFAFNKGIGFGIQNAHGQVVGIQVRRDEKKDEHASRYVWFSSSFAMYDDEKYEHGTSSGAPIDVVYPDVIKNRTVMITEGRFKAQVLAKTTGSICISVQGVSTWSGILKELREIMKSEKAKARFDGKFYIYCLLVAFDADMHYKVQVFDQLKKMTDQLEKRNYAVYYLSWDETLGKGIDDVILNGERKAIKRYDKTSYDESYQMVVERALEENGVEKVSDLKEEMMKKAYKKYMDITPLGKNERSRKHNAKIKSA